MSELCNINIYGIRQIYYIKRLKALNVFKLNITYIRNRIYIFFLCVFFCNHTWPHNLWLQSELRQKVFKSSSLHVLSFSLSLFTSLSLSHTRARAHTQREKYTSIFFKQEHENPTYCLLLIWTANYDSKINVVNTNNNFPGMCLKTKVAN